MNTVRVETGADPLGDTPARQKSFQRRIDCRVPVKVRNQRLQKTAFVQRQRKLVAIPASSMSDNSFWEYSLRWHDMWFLDGHKKN